MLYRKPEVVKLVNALDAIQSQGFKVASPTDHQSGQTQQATPNAYEADE